MQIYDLLTKVIENDNDLNIWYVTDDDLSRLGASVIVCGHIEPHTTYLVKQDSPFDDGYIADFVALDDYDTILFGYIVETELPF